MDARTIADLDRAHTGPGPRARHTTIADEYGIVELDLAPIAASIVSDLLRAATQTHTLALLRVAARADGYERLSTIRVALDRIAEAGHDPFTVLLYPNAAEVLAADLGATLEAEAVAS